MPSEATSDRHTEVAANSTAEAAERTRETAVRTTVAAQRTEASADRRTELAADRTVLATERTRPAVVRIPVYARWRALFATSLLGGSPLRWPALRAPAYVRVWPLPRGVASANRGAAARCRRGEDSQSHLPPPAPAPIQTGGRAKRVSARLSRHAICGNVKTLDLRTGGLPQPWPRPAA